VVISSTDTTADRQRTKWRRNIAENFSRAHERYRQTTDRQTDGQWHIANVNVRGRGCFYTTL